MPDQNPDDIKQLMQLVKDMAEENQKIKAQMMQMREENQGRETETRMQIRKMEEENQGRETETRMQMRKMEEENKKKMQKMEEENQMKIQEMEKNVQHLKGELERRLDPWARVRNGTATSSHKRQVQDQFRTILIEANGDRCQLTRHRGGCLAAHIIPLSSDLLGPSEISDIFNGILVLKPVEKAFDKQQIIFKCDDLKVEARLVVLDESILDNQVYSGGKTWRELQGKALDISKHRPSFRLLNLHAEYALKLCFENGKIDQKTFDQLMVFASFHTSPPRLTSIKRWIFEANQILGLASLQIIFSGVALMSFC
jgi:hypothetical protein